MSQHTPTLSEWAEHIMQTVWLSHSPRTRQTRTSIYHNHVEPYLAHLDIAGLTTPILHQWLADLTHTGVSIHIQRHAYDILRITTDEWHRHAGTINPVSQIKRPRAPEAAEKRAKDCTITRVEYAHLITCCNTTVEELLIRLSVDAGLRGGETTGLQRQHINLERRTITVKRQGERNTTKTGKRRKAAMTDELHALLAQHLDDLAVNGFDQADHYLFQGGHGERLP